MKHAAMGLALALALGCSDLGCSGSDRSRVTTPVPALDPAPRAVGEGYPVEPAGPAIDPTMVPDGAIATLSIGQPDAQIGSLGAYLTSAGISGAPAMLSNAVTASGLSVDQPIAILMFGTEHGPEATVAGTTTNAQGVRDFARMAGLAVDVRGAQVALGPPALLAVAREHLFWRLGQPLAAETRFQIAGDFIASLLAATSAIPGNPLAGFDSVLSVDGSVLVDASDLTVKLIVGARPGSGFAAFVDGLGPSDFRLASSVSSPDQLLFAAGTLHIGPVLDAMRGWLGPIIDAWKLMAQASDGAVAMSMTRPGSAVTLIGVADGAAAAAAYEQAIRSLATPVVSLHTATTGKLRVKKLMNRWFHEIIATPTPAATDAEREMIRRMTGAEVTRTLVGVVDNVAINAAGPARDKAIAVAVRRARQPGPINDPAAAAAIAEGRRAGESFVMVADLFRLVAMVKPGALPPATGRAPFRMGMSNVGGALGLRWSLPAQQLGALGGLAAAVAP